MTKDTEKALVILYSEYKRRCSFGTPISDAAYFEEAKLYAIANFSTWQRKSIDYCVSQLQISGYLKVNIMGDVTLLGEGIAFVEEKPKEYFDKFIEITKDILSLIPNLL